MLTEALKPPLSLLPTATRISQTAGLISEAWALSAAISMRAHRHTERTSANVHPKNTQMHRRPPLFVELNLEMWTAVRSCQPSSHKDKQHIAHFCTQIGGGEGDSGRGSWSKECRKK